MRYTDEMSTSIAQHLFNIMERDEIGPDGLALLSRMSALGQVKMSDPVKTDHKVAPLCEAMLTLVEPGKLTQSFYTAPVAQQLLDMDPKFFCQAPDPARFSLWLEYLLSGWSRHPDRQLYGFSSYNQDQIDKWATVAFESLPEQHRKNDGLWVAALKLGLPAAASVLVKHRKGGWAELDDKGKPFIARASGDWAWDLALASGLDPYAPASGRPFWRAVLPQSPSSPAEGGSVRAAVESWVCEQIRKPDSPPALLEYVRRLTVARMSLMAGNASWIRLSHKEQVEYVKSLPDQWASWNKEGVPLWLRMAGHRDDKMTSWVAKLDANPRWRSQIQKDPLAHLALATLRSHPNLPDIFPNGIDVASALADPRRNLIMGCVVNLTKANRVEFSAMLESWEMAARTPEAPSASRPRPRM
jgi:hypothetical protein